MSAAPSQPENANQGTAGQKRDNGSHSFSVITFEQKRKLKEWIDFADLGVELHEEAQRIYEKYSFYLQAAPTLLLSSIAAMLSAGFDAPSFYEATGGYVSHALMLSFLNATNTLLIGCANYWNWQAKAEANKFAAREYDKLRETLRVKKYRMEIGQVDFSKVLDEVDNAIVEVKKQCGPPPSGLLHRHLFRRSVADVSQVNELQSMYDSQSSIFSRVCQRCRKLLYPNSDAKRPAARNNAQRMLDVKIQRVKNATGDDSLAKLWHGVWETFEGAVERSDFGMASKLLTSIGALSDRECMSPILKWQGQHRTPLHIAIMHGNSDVCNFIFDKLRPDVVKFMCLKEDYFRNIPVQYVKGMHASIGPQLLFFTLRGLCDKAVRSMKAVDLEEGDAQDDSTAQPLERTQARSCQCFLDYLSSVKCNGMIAEIRDDRGYNMAHIAAEANDFDLLKGLLALENRPFNLSDTILDSSFAGKSSLESNKLKPDNVLAVALWGGCRDSMRAIVAHHLNGRGYEAKERRIVFNDALKAYVNKMLEAFKGHDGSLNIGGSTTAGGSDDFSVIDMVRQFAKATHDIKLSWSSEWLDELECISLVEVDESQAQSTHAVGKKNKHQNQPQRACSLKNLFLTVSHEKCELDHTLATHLSLLHYAVATSMPCVVEALVLSGHELQEDSHGLSPYDYLVLQMRLMLCPRQGDDDVEYLSNLAGMIPDRFRELKACFGAFFTHAADSKKVVAALSKFVPSTTMHKSWKEGRAIGTALHVACLLQDPQSLSTILKCREEKCDAITRLGLRQTIRECEKGERGLKAEAPESPHEELTHRTYMTQMVSKTPIELAVRYFLFPTAASGNREVLRLLLLHAANCNQRLAMILQDLCSELYIYSPHSPDSLDDETIIRVNHARMRNLVNMLFHRDELGKEWQTDMKGRRLFDKCDTSTVVTLPCEQFTFGAPAASQRHGRWYYEVEFADGVLHRPQLGVFIGWASEKFSKRSSTQVGGAPCSWSFTPSFSNKKGQAFSQLILAGSVRKANAFPDCRGVGVLIDLQTNKISWRVIHGDGSFSWVQSAGPNQICLGSPRDVAPCPEAQFDLGAWRLRDHEQPLMPCMSCYVTELQESAIAVHLTGKFNAPLPPECHPAIIVEDDFSEPILPFANEFGNSPSQSPPFYRYDCITLVHLAAMQGNVGLAETLVEKYDALYLPMLSLPEDHREYDYESLVAQRNRKCVSQDFDSLPYQVSDPQREPYGNALKYVNGQRRKSQGEKDFRRATSSERREDNQKMQVADTAAETALPTLLEGSSASSQTKEQVLSLQPALLPEHGGQTRTLNSEVPGSVLEFLDMETIDAGADLEAGTAGTTRQPAREPSEMLKNRNSWTDDQWR